MRPWCAWPACSTRSRCPRCRASSPTPSGGPGAVYVDLEAVTFIDSRGLGALLAANERAREGAPPVFIYRPSEAVQRLLDVSGVRGVLTEVEELPAA